MMVEKNLSPTLVRPIVCFYSRDNTRIKEFMQLFIKYASGLRYDFDEKSLEIKIKDIKICVDYSVSDNYLDKKLLMYTSKWGNRSSKRDNNGDLGIVKLIYLLSYARSLLFSPVADYGLVNMVGKEFREIYVPTYVSWAHNVIKKNYRAIIEYRVEPVFEVSGDPFNSALLLSSIISGVHRFGYAIRQLAFQQAFFEYLLKAFEKKQTDEDIRSTSKILATIMLDTLLYITIIVHLFKKGVIGTELIHNISAEPIKASIENPEIALENFKQYIRSENPRKTMEHLENILRDIGDMIEKIEDPRNIVELLNEFKIGLLREERSILCKVLGISHIDNISRGTEPLVGRGIRLVNDIVRLLASKNIDFDTLLLALTEQTSPALLWFIKEIIEISDEKKSRSIDKIILLFTQLTLYNAQLVVDYVKLRNNYDIGKIKLVPISSLDPIYNKIIAERIARKEKNMLAILQGSSNMVFSIATGLSMAGIKSSIMIV